MPRHLNAVAIRHPELRMVLAHLSHPFEGECIAVIRKHPHVYIARIPGIPGLDPLDADKVEEVIHRDALPLLGLA